MAVRFVNVMEASGEFVFHDVDITHWAFGYIAAAVDAGYISGYPDGSFRPDNTITRAEAVTILNRVRSCESITEGISFTDVPESHWVYEAITAAATEHEHK